MSTSKIVLELSPIRSHMSCLWLLLFDKSEQGRMPAEPNLWTATCFFIENVC